MVKPYQLGLMGILLMANIVSAVGIVYVKHLNRQSFIHLQTVEAASDVMDIEWGQLQLEQSTFGTHSEIEQLARKRLGMVMPAHNDIYIIEQSISK